MINFNRKKFSLHGFDRLTVTVVGLSVIAGSPASAENHYYP